MELYKFLHFFHGFVTRYLTCSDVIHPCSECGYCCRSLQKGNLLCLFNTYWKGDTTSINYVDGSMAN